MVILSKFYIDVKICLKVAPVNYLYDTSHPDSKNYLLKKVAFRNIAREISTSIMRKLQREGVDNFEDYNLYNQIKFTKKFNNNIAIFLFECYKNIFFNESC